MEARIRKGWGRGGVYVWDRFSHVGGQPHVASGSLITAVVFVIVEQHALFSPAVPRRCPRDTSVDRGRRRRRRRRETEKDEIAPVLARRTRDNRGDSYLPRGGVPKFVFGSLGWRGTAGPRSLF